MNASAPHPVPTEGLNDARVAQLWRVRTVLALLRAALGQQGDMADWLARHPVLQDTLNDAADIGLADLTLGEGIAHLDALLHTQAHSALGRLQGALSLDAHGLSAWVAASLSDDDPRFAPFIDDCHGQGGHITRATLVRLCGPETAALALQALRHAQALLEDQRTWVAHPALWALACGLPPPPGTWQHLPHAALPSLDELILPDTWRARLRQPMRRQAAWPGPAQPEQATAGVCWLLRGSPGSGRHSLAAALAQSAGLGLLMPAGDDTHTSPGAAPDPSLFTAAVLLNAMPLVSLAPAPGERVQWPSPPLRLPGAPEHAPGQAPGQAPLMAVRLPRHGGLGISGWDTQHLDITPPDATERQRHWQAALGVGGGATAGTAVRPGPPPEAFPEVHPELPRDVLGLRLPRGTLHRVAQTVRTSGLHPSDATAATALMPALVAQLEAQGRFALDGIARRMPEVLPAETLALPNDAQDEFDALVTRCRHRDALAEALPAAFGHASGVRALFKGPSGTGKTLAARHLAAALGRPLYRVDLAATVSKYIGETERNLERVFEAAESLDIVLLLDEGDALLAGRTQVGNATDRYANHETNYLLQRLEHYSGVLVVTTNAAERIDTAFARRMDVTLDFPLPDALTRLALWQAHLGPSEGQAHPADAADAADAAHATLQAQLERIALRCALSGGQIRNAALHATLLALERSRPAGRTGQVGPVGPVTPHDLRLALEREYRKAGQQCPSLDEVF